MLAVAMPRSKRGMKLQFSFDEDEVSLAWDAVRKAKLPAGSKVAVHGFETPLPAWFWSGCGLALADDAPSHVRFVPTTLGPSVVLHAAGAAPDIEPEAKRLFEAAASRREDAWQNHRLARDAPDAEGDYPLGAYVTQTRHDEVTAARMRLAAGTVATWTQVGAGAAPTEFARWQQAFGAYHSVLVAFPDGSRTVGLWSGEAAPTTGQTVQPALRRLWKTQGAWRHGVVFVPA
mgnify:CR=1 FL=1